MDSTAKNSLSKTIRELRAHLTEDFDHALEARYRLSKPAHAAGLDEERLAERERIEEWLAERNRGEQDKKKKQRRERADFIAEIVREAAYTLINRLVLLRLMEEAGLQKPAVLEGGWQSPGYREWCEWAPALLDDETDGYATLLGLVFDELAHDLPGLYGDVGLTSLVPVPPQTLRAAVEAIDNDELEPCWSDDTTLGWVYQYFNDPDREALDDKLNSRGKVEPHEVASKTQLFTERYMVEWLLQNSLGQMWLDMCAQNGWTPDVVEHGVLDALEERRADWRERREAGAVDLDELMPIESEVEERWKYYVPQGTDGVSAPENGIQSLRDLKLLDPACGSGHFLVIAFDLLFALYKEEARHRSRETGGDNWTDAQITRWIIEDNLHGIDIDRRAVQIAAAALYLKGRTQVPDFCPKTLNLVAPDLSIGHLPDDDPALVELREAVEHEAGIPADLVDTILDSLQEAYHLGSLLKLDDEIDAALEEFEEREQGDLFDGAVTTLAEPSDARVALLDALERFLCHHSSSDDLGLRLHGEQLANGIRFVRLNQEGRYDLVVANPPYLGEKNLEDTDYLETNYSRGKTDLYGCFMLRGLEFTKLGGLSAMVTMRNWMFIRRYRKLRQALNATATLNLIADLRTGAFEEIGGEVVGAAMHIFSNKQPADVQSVALSVPTKHNSVSLKRLHLLKQSVRHEFSVAELRTIELQPVVYWWEPSFAREYKTKPKFDEIYELRAGLSTQDNTRFVRTIWETASVRQKPPVVAGLQGWAPFIKGAAGKEWIEPLEHVVDWDRNGLEVKLNARFHKGSITRFVAAQEFYFSRGVAYRPIGNSFRARVHRFESIISNMGASVFSSQEELANVVCVMNSGAAKEVVEALNPGTHFELVDVKRIPAFEIAQSDEIFAVLDEAFTEHEAAREASVEFKKPGPSCWEYAQQWAQQAVDRPEGQPLPEWAPEYEEAPSENWLSWAVGVAVGRFDANGEQGWLDEAPEDALDAGTLYVSATDFDDALDADACTLLHQMWESYGDEVGRNKDDLNSWLREKFFKGVHRQMYDNAPIYFPVSSQDKNFVAHINIHRWQANTLRRLLAEWLMPERKQLEQLRDNLRSTHDSSEGRAQINADKRLDDTKDLLEELEQFIADVRQCAEFGPPPTDSDRKKCPERECDATYEPVLDDGTMINAAALWPILDPQWRKYPKKWWTRLANQKGYRGKHFDWSMLAARYWPTRVDEKCQEDPSLAVAHDTFWKYHPERAYEWELRLQDEIGPDFTIDEGDADEHRERFLREQPEKAREIEEDEMTRRKREAKKVGESVEEVQPVLV